MDVCGLHLGKSDASDFLFLCGFLRISPSINLKVLSCIPLSIYILYKILTRVKNKRSIALNGIDKKSSPELCLWRKQINCRAYFASFYLRHNHNSGDVIFCDEHSQHMDRLFLAWVKICYIFYE